MRARGRRADPNAADKNRVLSPRSSYPENIRTIMIEGEPAHGVVCKVPIITWAIVTIYDLEGDGSATRSRNNRRRITVRRKMRAAENAVEIGHHLSGVGRGAIL